MNEEDFRAEVNNKVKQGLSFVLAVYKTLDEFVAQEIKVTGLVLACKKGCSFCCNQLITCTEIEMNEIVQFLKKLPRKVQREIVTKAQRKAAQWRQYFDQKKPTVDISFSEISHRHQDWRNRPCPFLNTSRGLCYIYPVRTMDCRTLSSTTPCTSWRHPDAKRFRFQCETWANNMIMDKQAEFGPMTVTPLLHWLLLKKI